MEKKICFTVDSDIYEKFCLALNLTNESENVAIETCMRWYIVTDDESMQKLVYYRVICWGRRPPI